MGRGGLSDAERERLRPFPPVSNGSCGRWRDHRQVIDGNLHRVRTGVQWPAPQERFGPWKTVYERHPHNTAIEPPLRGAENGIDLCQALVQPTGPQGNTAVAVARHLVADP
ncbi:transposase [Streptomyces goshikiensis]|uniref:transposase n=1 Tax=Streptomyces goshikiensis TaxID=1942 RepID=UPI003F4D3102